VLAGYDPRDPRTRPGSDFAFADFAARRLSVRGLRVGVLRSDGTGQPFATPEVLAGWQVGVEKLADAGAELVEIDWPELPALRTVGGALIGQEAIAYHQPNLRTRFHEYGDFLQQRILAPYAYDTGAFVRAQQLRGELRRRANRLFERIDLLTTPSIPTVAPLLGVIGSVALSIPFNLLGWPAISLPVGNTPAGLPVGLQLVGKPWDELTVLQAAQALEETL
jgi:aspartyl-tRNA(Asn)/glutamyl-tRNA(Gln) amidotransferase subunit A